MSYLFGSVATMFFQLFLVPLARANNPARHSCLEALCVMMAAQIVSVMQIICTMCFREQRHCLIQRPSIG